MTTSSSSARLATVVLDVRELQYATEKFVIQAILRRRPGIHRVEANPVSQTATVTFDQGVTSVRELARCIEACGYHSVGQSVPAHLFDPFLEPAPTPAPTLAPTLPSPAGGGGEKSAQRGSER